MHKFRTILSVVATAAMVLGTMGAASAAGTTNMTRADFIVQLDQTLGIQPVSPTTPNFTDVATTDANYGYIEAAYQKGFINGISGDASKGTGVFGPTLPITRAQAAKVLVEAYEGGNYTPTQTSTTFTDNTSIPSALVGFVAEASTLKLMQGFTSGSFGPNAYLTTAQETHLIAQLQAVMASAAFKVSASSTDVGVGQLVTLSSTGTGTTTYAVTGANASSALLSGSTFVASAAGNYTVTGTNSGLTASVTIGVYGTASALKISAPTTVVANGASQTNVTVSVVDANGNVVANNTDNISLASNNTSAAGVAVNDSASAVAGPVTVAAVNGVATFVLTSGNVPGAVATLTATDASGTSLSATSYTSTVTATVQQATSLSVSAESNYVSVNSGNNPVVFDVQVLDQSGQPMLYGTYPFSATVSGPAQFTDGTTTAHSFAYTGVSPYYTTVTVDGLQGQTGAITLNVTGTNLTAATGTATAVIAGSATALQLTAPSTTTVSEDTLAYDSGSNAANFNGDALPYTVQVVDANGYPVSNSGLASATVTVKDSSGNSVSNFVSNNDTTFTTTSTVTLTNGQGTFYIQDGNTQPSADAGTYTVQVSATGYTSSAADQFTVTAGNPAQLAWTGSTYIAASNPTNTIGAQVEDEWGNDVAVAGIPITFGAPTANANNANMTLSTTSAYTNASGLATTTATVPAYVAGTGTANQYTVYASGEYNAANANLFVGSATGSTLSTDTADQFGFAVQSSVATSMQVKLVNDGPGTYIGSNGVAVAGQQVTASVYALDQYGNDVMTPDNISLSFGGTGSVAAAQYDTSGTIPTASTLLTTTSSSSSSVSGTGDNLIPNTGNNSSVAYFTFWAYGSGTVTVTASDASAPGSVSASGALSVLPSSVAQFALLDSSSNNANGGETVSANTPLALTLSGTDAYGNVSYQTTSGIAGYVVALAAYANSGLSTPANTGSFRLSSNGATASAVVMTAGQTAVPVYYVDSIAETAYLASPGFATFGNPTTSGGYTSVTFSGLSSLVPVNSPGVTVPSGTTLQWTAGTSGTATLSANIGGQTVTFQYNY